MMWDINEWQWVNLLLPALLPVFVLFLVAIFPKSQAQQQQASPWVAVKDGQLAWAALGMAAAALYELRHPVAGAVLPSAWETLSIWLVVGGILASGIFAAMAPVFPTPAAVPGGLSRLWHFRVFFISVVLTMSVGWLYNSIHLTTQTATAKKSTQGTQP